MDSLLSDVLKFTNQDFNLEIPATEVSTQDEFLKLLTNVIQHLLDKDFERLMNGLYRIDVDEKKVKLAMTTDNVAENIAILIIERELQKVETRRKYRQ